MDNTNLLRLAPIRSFLNAITEADAEVPLLKFVKSGKGARKGAAASSDTSTPVGYAAALKSRTEFMDSAGLLTSLPTLSKEEKKAEKKQKKALTNAKHLMK